MRHLRSGLAVPLRGRARVGRSPDTDVGLEDGCVSVEHALIRWTDGAWMLQDLGSTNGTFLDGRRLNPGEPIPLTQGVRLGFGMVEPSWTLEDEAPPTAFARTSGGDLRMFSGERLALPSEEALVLAVFRGADGSWLLQRGGREERVRDGSVVELEGQTWTLFLPEALPRTLRSRAALRLRDLRLRFLASQDLEHIEVIMVARGEERSLGEHAYGLFLMELARQRRADRAAGVSASEQGWVSKADQETRHRLRANQMNVWMTRFRQDLERVGVEDASGVFEKRERGRTIRLAVEGSEG